MNFSTFTLIFLFSHALCILVARIMVYSSNIHCIQKSSQPAKSHKPKASIFIYRFIIKRDPISSSPQYHFSLASAHCYQSSAVSRMQQFSIHQIDYCLPTKYKSEKRFHLSFLWASSPFTTTPARHCSGLNWSDMESLEKQKVLFSTLFSVISSVHIFPAKRKLDRVL